MQQQFDSIRRLEKVLISKRILFKKITIIPKGQAPKMKGVVCNVPIGNEDVNSLLPLPRAADSNGIVIVKLKRKLEYKGHMYFESVRRQFIFDLLNYLKQHNNLYTDITINTENISNNMSTLTDPNNDSDELIQEFIHSINTPISIVLEKQHSELKIL